MKLRAPPEAFGNAIFCDDIRMEIGNKITYVGCYFGYMFLPDFPATIPRLCVAVTYSQKRGKVVLPVKFVIFLPEDPEDKPSIQFGTPDEVSEAALADMEATAVALGESPQLATFSAQIGITGLSFAEPGAIKVRAVRGNELVRLGTLRISRASS
jgi:hypothetical protein